jgi:hypothetical protein
MSMRRRVGGFFVASAGACLAALLCAAADAPKKTAPGPAATPATAKPAAPSGPAPPKPGAEHLLLARGAGIWDATVEFKSAHPGAPAQVSKGVETGRLCCGGLWLLTDFKSAPPAAAFEGHGSLGYDPATRRYVATWVDGELTRPMLSEGAFDAAGKVLTLKGRMVRASGEPVNWTEVETWKDDDHRVLTMAMSGPDGAESQVFTITYARRR